MLKWYSVNRKEELDIMLDAAEYEASSGGGMVSVKLSGKRELTEIHIDPQVVDPDDIDMLQDLIMAAVNEALSQAETANDELMRGISSGLDLSSLPI
jgi:DNA-binding YbaB/EbfC family protein